MALTCLFSACPCPCLLVPVPVVRGAYITADCVVTYASPARKSENCKSRRPWKAGLRLTTGFGPQAGLRFLLHPQRFRGVHAGGAASGEISSERGRSDQPQRHGCVGRRINGPDAKEQG